MSERATVLQLTFRVSSSLPARDILKTAVKPE
jgi:hypothetical protein